MLWASMCRCITWKLVSGQTEGITDDLFVHLSPDLEDDLVDGNSGRPMIERTLTLTHTHLYRKKACEHIVP